MTEQVMRPLSVLIAALGGEGGGVLTNWIVAAAQTQGLPVQATSIPGVAQRTGATTYYIEIWPLPVTDGKHPVLSLSPAPGEVDIVATTEFLEAGRCILNGLVSPDRTHLIASTHRVYTTFEKMAVGDGRFDLETLLSACKTRSRDAQLLDLDALALSSGSRINAVLLGVLVGSGKLPVTEAACRDAITTGRIAVDANLRGFAAGLKVADQQEVRDVGADTSALLREAETRLSSYQGADYAQLFNSRMQPFADSAPELLTEVAKGLTRRMAYEDIIRVAQLKTRTGRRGHLAGGFVEGEVVHITEYFRPGLREVCDILPAIIARRVLSWASVSPGRMNLSWPMAMRSTTITGFLMLRFLASLRVMRRLSYRYGVEQAAIEGWLADINKARGTDQGLALEIAKNARLIKGYGDTHARGVAAYDAINDDLVSAALKGQEASVEAIAAARNQALSERPG